MTTRDKIAHAVLRPINPSLLIILGVYTVVWGLWIANPFWTVFTQASLFSVMAKLAPETFWGIQAIIAGTFVVWGVWRQNFKSIQRGSIIAFIHWFAIGVLYFLGDWQNTGGITGIFIAIYSAIVWLNMKINREYYHYLE